MKIGILTLSASDNCGSLLQCYALQYILENLYGHSVEVIDFRPDQSRKMYSVIPRNPFQEKRRFLNVIFHYGQLKYQSDRYEQFRRDFLKMTQAKYLTFEELHEITSDFDCAICGSDQVWNVAMPDFDDAYFLGWYQGKKKIAYAVSLGRHLLQEHAQFQKVAEWIQQFDYISVREDISLTTVGDIYPKGVSLCLDPTLLFTHEQWEKLPGKRFVSERYIFYYSWAYNNDYINRMVQEISKKEHLPVYVINASKWLKYRPSQYGFRLCSDAGPMAFLNLTKYAEYALVQSFHGIILGYQMRRNFWFLDDVPEEKMDVRISQVLSLLGAKDRVIREFHASTVLYPYDYGEDNIELENRRAASFDFLNSALKKDNGSK